MCLGSSSTTTSTSTRSVLPAQTDTGRLTEHASGVIPKRTPFAEKERLRFGGVSSALIYCEIQASSQTAARTEAR